MSSKPAAARTIAWQWRGWAPKEYLDLFATVIHPKLSAISGFRGSQVLVRELGAETEIVTITFFDRLEDMIRFAGNQYETANVSAEARAILSRFDETVFHFEVAFELKRRSGAARPTRSDSFYLALSPGLLSRQTTSRLVSKDSFCVDLETHLRIESCKRTLPSDHFAAAAS